VTKTDLHRLVDELPEDLVDGTVALLRRVIDRRVNPDQAWFWTDEWQAGEREADADIAAGRFRRFDGDEAFLDHLQRLPPAAGSGE
jgi:hypothetical protein